MGRDLSSQNLAEILQALGQIPGGADYINIPEIVKEVLRSKDIVNDSVILPDEEVKKRREDNAQSEVAKQAQIAQAQNLAKPKAETTRNDAILAALERTPPTDPIYPIMYGKLLSGYDELDDQARAALDIMKTRIVVENKTFADQQDLALMQQDIQMAQQLGQMQGQVPQPQAATPETLTQQPPVPQSPSPEVVSE